LKGGSCVSGPVGAMARCRPRLLGLPVVAIVGCIAQLAMAKFTFDGLAPLQPLTLQQHYLFYVLIPSNAKGQKQASATVTVDAKIAPRPSAQETVGYKGLHVAILPHDDFDKFVDTKRFCDARDRLVLAPDAAKQADLLAGPFLLTGQNESKQQAVLTRSGVYTLVIANCGNLTDVEISGSVSVKNPHGFLPATDYNKEIVYWGFLVFYLLATSGWLVATLSLWEQLFEVQKDITAVSLLGAIECCLMGIVYRTSNQTDSFSENLFVLACLASMMKVCGLLRMAKQSTESFGGIEGATSGTLSNIMVNIVIVIYVVAEFNFRQVLRVRFAYALKSNEVMLNAVPCLLAGLVVYIWGHLSLLRQRDAAKDHGRANEVLLITRSHVVLCFGTVGALLVGFAQLADTIDNGSISSWKSHCLISDGLPQLIFTMVLVSCMFVWWPADGALAAEHGVLATDEESQPIGAIFNDDALDDDVDKGVAPAE